MKKVLHRSFKPAKCKTALQMAISRLKILKNKKDTQIKQLRRDLAHLLESGQTQTAQIRVEHVVREEKTATAYELVGIYCELLVARLGVIDSQKTCPSDLKEAVASVLYASQRLSSDASELADVVKQFSAKYGKDFVSAAIALQPDSGVSRLLVEKLSVKAPDGSAKIKILTEIAIEHNVTWEGAESLIESDPKKTELLSSGASSSQSTCGVSLDSSRIANDQAPAVVHVSQNSYATDGRSSSHAASTDFNIGKAADRCHAEQRPPNPSHGDSSPWETGFVDATTAARAAAESAERASFAARAAAELSCKEKMMQHSTEPPKSLPYDGSRNDPLHTQSSISNRQDDQSTTRVESPKKTVDELSENTSWSRGHSRANSLEMRPNENKKQPSMDDINQSSSEHVRLKKQSGNISDDNDATALDHTQLPNVVVSPAFDDYSSLFDKTQFDKEDAYGDEPEQGLGFSLLGSRSKKANDHIPTETNSWSFGGKESLGQPSSASTSEVLEKEKQPDSPLFDDGPASPPTSLHESEPSAKFDDYNRDSESEEDNLREKEILSGHVEEKPKLTSQRSAMSEVPDDLGRYFFPSDTEDDFMPEEESDPGSPIAMTLPSYGMNPPREETLSKSAKENVQTEVAPARSTSQTVSSSSLRKDLSQKARNPDKRSSSLTADTSSSDDETEMGIFKSVSIRKQDERTESRTRPTHKTTLASASYFHSVSSDDEDDKKFHRDASGIVSKPSISISRRTKGQERRSSVVTAKTDKTSHDQVSPPKQKGPASSISLPKTKKASHDQESPPKLDPTDKPLAYQENSASSSSSLPKTVTSPDPETPAKEKASHVHPKLPDYDDIFAKLGARHR